MIVVVCALRAGCGCPDTGARDQYMPLAGAGSTSGDVVGEASGGKGLYVSPDERLERVVLAEERWCVVERVLPLRVLLSPAPLPPVAGADAPGLLTIADVDRRFVGRCLLVLGPSLDTGLCCASAVLSASSGFRLVEDDVVEVLMLSVWPFKDCAGVEVVAEAAADWARCLIESSEVEGFLLEAWLLEGRWPGVWPRGIGGAWFAESSISLEGSYLMEGAVVSVGSGKGDVAPEILWERTVLVRRVEVDSCSLSCAA